MTSVGERGFHILLGALFVGSLFLDEAMNRMDAAWNPPRVGFVTLVIGLIWVGRWAAWQRELSDERLAVLEDRLERTERRALSLEDDARRR